MMHGITLVSLIICCEDFVFSLIDRPSLLPVRDMIFCDKVLHIYFYLLQAPLELWTTQTMMT